MEPETLRTRRLVLRPPGPRDAGAVHAACQDSAIQRWTTVPAPYLPAHAADFVHRTVPEGWRDGTSFTFGLFLGDGGGVPGYDGTAAGMCAPDDDGSSAPGGGGGSGTAAAGGTLAGVVGITRQVMGAGEIGYWTAREHRRRGYLTEAIGAVARWAFTRAGIERLEWRAEVGNVASRAAAERAGFTVEGTLRSAIVHQGVRRDAWVGSLLPYDLGVAGQAYVPGRGTRAAARSAVGRL
jgi:RimJ/RimL family protein N-acetyltransferase